MRLQGSSKNAPLPLIVAKVPNISEGGVATRLTLSMLNAFLLSPPRRLCFRRCLFVCLLATLRKNFRTDLHEIFRKGCNGSLNKWLNFVGAISIRFARWRDWYRDTGKTCVGGGMHCPSASSYLSSSAEYIVSQLTLSQFHCPVDSDSAAP